MDDIANFNGMLPLATISLVRADGGKEGGRGLQMSYLSATKGAHRNTGFF